MSIGTQIILTFVVLFVVLVTPCIAYVIIRNRKYVDEVDAEVVRLEKKFKLYYGGDVKIPVYRYTYNYTTYETESRHRAFKTFVESIDEPVVKLKVNPDDPYDVLECKSFFKLKRRSWNSYDTVILIACIITIILTVYFVFKYA